MDHVQSRSRSAREGTQAGPLHGAGGNGQLYGLPGDSPAAGVRWAERWPGYGRLSCVQTAPFVGKRERPSPPPSDGSWQRWPPVASTARCATVWPGTPRSCSGGGLADAVGSRRRARGAGRWHPGVRRAPDPVALSRLRRADPLPVRGSPDRPVLPSSSRPSRELVAPDQTKSGMPGLCPVGSRWTFGGRRPSGRPGLIDQGRCGIGRLPKAAHRRRACSEPRCVAVVLHTRPVRRNRGVRRFQRASRPPARHCRSPVACASRSESALPCWTQSGPSSRRRRAEAMKILEDLCLARGASRSAHGFRGY